MKRVSFREALEMFGDMLNQEADRLQTSPDSILAKIMEYGPQGAAIREDVRDRVFMATYRVEPEALKIAYCLPDVTLRQRNAIIARHVMRDLRTDRQRAVKCECSLDAFQKNLKRGRKKLKEKYLRMSPLFATFS